MLAFETMTRNRPHIPGLLPARPARTRITEQRGGLSRDAYEAIRTAILDCTFLPGMALSEQGVSEQLQVSRAPVRDAFRQLATEGLVEAVPQRGTFVSRLNRDKIADAVFVRESIECRAAELAAQAPQEQRRLLTQIVNRQANASAKKDYATHLATDEEFHHAILDLAGHPHAWPALRLARTGMNRIRHLAIPAVGSHRIAIDHHRRIVDCILEGRPRDAAEAMRVHVYSPLAFLDAIFRDHPDYFES